ADAFVAPGHLRYRVRSLAERVQPPEVRTGGPARSHAVDAYARRELVGEVDDQPASRPLGRAVEQAAALRVESSRGQGENDRAVAVEQPRQGRLDSEHVRLHVGGEDLV